MYSYFLNNNGTVGYVSGPSDNAFIFQANIDFCISFWARLDMLPNMGDTILSFREHISGMAGWAVYFSNNMSELNVEINGNIFTFNQNINIAVGEWTHFVITCDRDAIDGLKLYVNGNYTNQDFDPTGFAAAAINSGGDDFSFGAIQNPLGIYVSYFNGSFDSIGIFQGIILDENDVADLYNDGNGTKLSTDDAGLTAGFNFDEGGGIYTYDVVNNLVAELASEYNYDPWNSGGIGQVISALPSEIAFYLTSSEPSMFQSNYSQSIGGYVSNSVLYQETSLNENVGLYDEEINIIPIAGWEDIKYISVGGEVMKVDYQNNTFDVVTRGVNGVLESHLDGDIVQNSLPRGIFNNNLNNNYKQYRCIAVRNNSNVSIYNTFVFIKRNSRNPNVNIKIAIEKPLNQDLSSSTTEWNNMQFIDDSLIGIYDDNYFKDALLRIEDAVGVPNRGQERIISSYDGSSGTFTFYNALPTNYSDGLPFSINYEVEPGPAQRIKTGTISPTTGTSRVSIFSKAASYYPISINVEGSVSGGTLAPNNIFYIWIEREILKGSEYFEADECMLTIFYSKESL